MEDAPVGRGVLKVQPNAISFSEHKPVCIATRDYSPISIAFLPEEANISPYYTFTEMHSGK